MTTEQIIMLIVAIFMILIITVIILLYINKKKSAQAPAVAKSFVMSLVEALGGKENISDTELEHSRLKLILNDIKAVDQEKLKSIKVSAVLKGREIKLLIKENANEIYEEIIKLKKGE